MTRDSFGCHRFVVPVRIAAPHGCCQSAREGKPASERRFVLLGRLERLGRSGHEPPGGQPRDQINREQRLAQARVALQQGERPKRDPSAPQPVQALGNHLREGDAPAVVRDGPAATPDAEDGVPGASGGMPGMPSSRRRALTSSQRATRYEKRARAYRALVVIASIMIWLDS